MYNNKYNSYADVLESYMIAEEGIIKNAINLRKKSKEMMQKMKLMKTTTIVKEVLPLLKEKYDIVPGSSGGLTVKEFVDNMQSSDRKSLVELQIENTITSFDIIIKSIDNCTIGYLPSDKHGFGLAALMLPIYTKKGTKDVRWLNGAMIADILVLK